MLQAIVFSLIFFISVSSEAKVKSVAVGWVEHVTLKDTGTVLKAKLDTGANTSSIDAEIINIVEDDENAPSGTTGDKVIFSILDPATDKRVVFARHILRYVKIKRKISGMIRRPVVVMTFCIGGRTSREEVNLADRENFIYPVLIGRNMLAHVRLTVDAAKKYTRRPTCGTVVE